MEEPVGYLAGIEARGCNRGGEHGEGDHPQAAQAQEEGPWAQLRPRVQDAILESRVLIHLHRRKKMAQPTPATIPFEPPTIHYLTSVCRLHTHA